MAAIITQFTGHDNKEIIYVCYIVLPVANLTSCRWVQTAGWSRSCRESWCGPSWRRCHRGWSLLAVSRWCWWQTSLVRRWRGTRGLETSSVSTSHRSAARVPEERKQSKPNSVTLPSSLATRRRVRDHIPLHYPACDQLASWSQTC